jgi:formylglycine-generating enzyme required for sulfatase activity
MPVGSFDGAGDLGDGTSPTGVHDMSANAKEWTADCADPGATQASGCDRVMRGFGVDATVEWPLRATSRASMDPIFGNGFRCAISAVTDGAIP